MSFVSTISARITFKVSELLLSQECTLFFIYRYLFSLVFGRSRIMQKALTDEFVNAPEGIEGLAPLIRGSRALLFTSEEPKKINQFFESYNPEEFARGGFIADRTIVLQKGVESLSKFPGNMEVQLRKLGLTTSLKEGVIHLLGDFNVCKAGKPLTPEQAQIVKLLGIKMAKFSGEVVAVYNSADSGIEKFVDENEDDDVDAEFEDIEEIEIDHENMA